MKNLLVQLLFLQREAAGFIYVGPEAVCELQHESE